MGVRRYKTGASPLRLKKRNLGREVLKRLSSNVFCAGEVCGTGILACVCVVGPAIWSPAKPRGVSHRGGSRAEKDSLVRRICRGYLTGKCAASFSFSRQM